MKFLGKASAKGFSKKEKVRK